MIYRCWFRTRTRRTLRRTNTWNKCLATIILLLFGFNGNLLVTSVYVYVYTLCFFSYENNNKKCKKIFQLSQCSLNASTSAVGTLRSARHLWRGREKIRKLVSNRNDGLSVVVHHRYVTHDILGLAVDWATMENRVGTCTRIRAECNAKCTARALPAAPFGRRPRLARSIVKIITRRA